MRFSLYETHPRGEKGITEFRKIKYAEYDVTPIMAVVQFILTVIVSAAAIFNIEINSNGINLVFGRFVCVRVCVLVYRHIHCRLAYKLYSCIYVYAFNIDLVFELLLFIDIIVVVVFLLLFITIRTEIKPIQVMRRFYSFNPMSRSFSLSPNMATKWIRKFSLFHTFFDCYSFDPSKIVNLLDVLWPKS